MTVRAIIIPSLGLFAAPAAPAEGRAFTVTNVNDSGPGSLRQAIIDANLTVAADVVAFNIPGGERAGIHLQSALPTVVHPLIIDGTTEPDYAGEPLIELDGTNVDQANGLYLLGQGSGVRGLAIEYFAATGVWLGGNNQFVEDSILESNYDGVRARRVSGCVIRDNVLSENYYAGVQLIAGGGHLVTGNTIEMNQRGVVPYNSGNNRIENNQIIANTQQGIYLIGAGSQDNFIRDNVIEANLGNGVFVAVGAARTTVEGNVVRNNLSGIVTNNGIDFVAVVNIVENNQQSGIVISTDYAKVEGNIVSGHSLGGVRIVQGDYNTLNDNWITDNPGDGVYVVGDYNTGTGNTIVLNGRDVFIAQGIGNDIGTTP